jgi:hypothetical protein
LCIFYTLIGCKHKEGFLNTDVVIGNIVFLFIMTSPLYPSMLRPFLLLSFFCLVAAVTSTAQTKQQVDSLEAAFLKQIKDSPTPLPGTQVRKVHTQLVFQDSFHLSKVLPYEVHAIPQIFETAYFEGTKTTQDSVNVEFYSIDIGNIQIESGKIIACDPIVMKDAAAFAQTFPTGQFPVQLAIARLNGQDERVAYSRICFSQVPVVKWEFALRPGQKPMPIGGKSIYGYGVDAGEGLFIDSSANLAFSKLRKADEDVWEDVFVKDAMRHEHTTWEYSIAQFEKHNLAAFSTGVGDGFYATYVGYDAQGRPCRLLTDFGLIGWWGK